MRRALRWFALLGLGGVVGLAAWQWGLLEAGGVLLAAVGSWLLASRRSTPQPCAREIAATRAAELMEQEELQIKARREARTRAQEVVAERLREVRGDELAKEFDECLRGLGSPGGYFPRPSAPSPPRPTDRDALARAPTLPDEPNTRG